MNTKKPSAKATTAKTSNESTVNAEQNAPIAAEAVAELAATDSKVSSKKSKLSKTKVIRDSFSFPETDYQKISELKKTCLAAGIHVKKSEVLRAGLFLLTQLSLDELKQVVGKVEKIKTGRPADAGD